MSLKRRLSEYHDPDYPQDGPTSPKKLPKLDSKQRFDKIREIIKREYHKELLQKEEEIQQIDQKLQQSKKLLQRVRYSVVATYYSKKNLEYSENELRQKEITALTIDEQQQYDQPSTSNKSLQNAIHPSLKRLLGKSSVNYDEILSVRPARQAAQTARASISEKLVKTKKDDKKIKQEDVQIFSPPIERPKIPIQRLTVARGRNQFRHLIVVGNTSQYIGNDKSANGVTHKWLIYVKTKDSDVDIQQIVTKIRFFLHPSYKPNDVIEVSSFPFQLSRRGWGEFPVRVQLYFHSDIQQKPLQIIHNLILDKRLTGLQTMGAETVVELWLNVPNKLENSDNESNTNCPSTLSRSEMEENNSKKQFDFTLNVEKTDEKPPEIDRPPQNTTTCHETSQVEQHPVTLDENIFMDPALIKQEKISIEDNQHLNVTNTLDKSINIKNPIQVKNNTEHQTLNHAIEITNIKVESMPIVAVETARSSIQNTSTATTTTEPPKPVMVQKPLRTQLGKNKNLFKCLDSNGKLITVELSVDPNNKKNIKIIKIPSIVNQAAATFTAKAATTTPDKKPTTPTQKEPVLLVKQAISGAAMIPSKPKIITVLASKQQTPQLSTILFNSVPKTSIINRGINGPPKLVPVSNVIVANTDNVENNILRVPSITTNVHHTQVEARDPPSTPVVNNSKMPPLIFDLSKETTNHKTAIIRNGQIIVTSHEKQKQKPKQESLLKPKVQQISLLKQNLTSTQYTQLHGKPVNTESKSKQSALSDIQLIPRIIPYSSKIETKIPSAYMVELRQKFFQINSFHSMRYAIGFLLKHIPLIHELAKSEQFLEHFPFAVENDVKFDSLMLPKKLCYEWTRAKLINRLIRQHDSLKQFTPWTTKEIILFARQFGYTPFFSIKPLLSTNNLADLIKKEIKQEPIDTLTSNCRIYNWMQSQTPSFDLEQTPDTSCDDEINIIDIDDNRVKANLPTKIVDNARRPDTSYSWLQFDEKQEKETEWIADICRSMKIDLRPEEIIPGVKDMMCQRLLVQSLHSFLEHLLRRAYSKKTNTDQKSYLTTDNMVSIHDIRKAIATTSQFDFLSNSNMGVVSCTDEGKEKPLHKSGQANS